MKICETICPSTLRTALLTPSFGNGVHSHTCDKFKKGFRPIREVFFSLQGGFSKMYIEYKGKLLIQIREISKFCKKLLVLEEFFGLISGNLPDYQVGFTCMHSRIFLLGPYGL